MGFLKKILSFFSLPRDESHESNDAANDAENDRAEQEATRHRGPTEGFSVQVPAPVDHRPPPHLGPVLIPCHSRQGEVQGLKWYAKRLKMDEDGDVADEFIDEVLPETSVPDNQIPAPKVKVNCNARPVKIRKQIMDGRNLLNGVEYKGRLHWFP